MRINIRKCAIEKFESWFLDIYTAKNSIPGMDLFPPPGMRIENNSDYIHAFSITVFVTAIFIKLSVAFYTFEISFVSIPKITSRLRSVNPDERDKIRIQTCEILFEYRFLFNLPDSIKNTQITKIGYMAVSTHACGFDVNGIPIVCHK